MTFIFHIAKINPRFFVISLVECIMSRISVNQSNFLLVGIGYQIFPKSRVYTKTHIISTIWHTLFIFWGYSKISLERGSYVYHGMNIVWVMRKDEFLACIYMINNRQVGWISWYASRIPFNHGTGASSLKPKQLQNIVEIQEEVLYEVFLGIHKP